MIITAKKRKVSSTRRTWTPEEISAVPEKEYSLTEAGVYLGVTKRVLLYRMYRFGILVRGPIPASDLRRYMQAWSEEQYVTL